MNILKKDCSEYNKSKQTIFTCKLFIYITLSDNFDTFYITYCADKPGQLGKIIAANICVYYLANCINSN